MVGDADNQHLLSSELLAVDLRGAVAVVTGSTSGIGAGIARALHAHGVRLVLNSRNSVDAGTRLAAQLEPAVYRRADVTHRAAAQELVDAAITSWGRLDIVVNNAGGTQVIPHADLDAVTDEVWAAMWQVNVLGAWHLTQAAVPAMSRGGSIINISSMAGVEAMGSSIPYAASKAALNHLTRLLARTLGPAIRVNAVAPGLIDTPWTQHWSETRSRVSEQAPLQRVGSAADVSDACLALLQQRYVTGVVLPVDGGMRLT